MRLSLAKEPGDEATFKTATSIQEILWGGAFSLCFERNCDITPALFDRGGSVLAVGRHFVGARAQMTHQPQVRRRHRVTETRNLKDF